MKEIISLFFPTYRAITSLLKDPIFCRHEMKYWDMKWIVDEDVDKEKTKVFYSPHGYSFLRADYRRFNGKVWENIFCECQKCGVQKKKSMMVGKFGKWENFNFTPTSSGVIDVEIYEVGKETKKQKRDRLINEILSK